MSNWCEKCTRTPYGGCDDKRPIFGLDFDEMAKKLPKNNAEIEKLKVENVLLENGLEVALHNQKQIRVETIDEFEESLKHAFNFGYTILEKSICDVIHQVAINLKEEFK